MFIATLIAEDRLEKGELSLVQDRLDMAGCQISGIGDMMDEKAVDIRFAGNISTARNAVADIDARLDIVVQLAENRRKKLLISDMDSTMITVECIDELASYAGIKDQIAEITERAMQGELDFEDALRGRVALLKDLEISAIDRCLEEKVVITPGASTLVRTMAGWGAQTILVSGGFTRFADPVGHAIGFDQARANILGETDGLLTGTLDGEIVDAAQKTRILEASARSLDLSLEECLAVGDGANDIPMIARAGLGIAYHAKPKAAEAADAAIRYNDLTALLYLQGIESRDWTSE